MTFAKARPAQMISSPLVYIHDMLCGAHIQSQSLKISQNEAKFTTKPKITLHLAAQLKEKGGLQWI